MGGHIFVAPGPSTLHRVQRKSAAPAHRHLLCISFCCKSVRFHFSNIIHTKYEKKIPLAFVPK